MAGAPLPLYPFPADLAGVAHSGGNSRHCNLKCSFYQLRNLPLAFTLPVTPQQFCLKIVQGICVGVANAHGVSKNRLVFQQLVLFLEFQQALNAALKTSTQAYPERSELI